VSSSNLWIKNENLLWLWVSFVVEALSNLSGGGLVGTNLFWLSLSIESGVGSGNFWIKNENFLWLWISLIVEVLSNISSGSLVSTSWLFLSKSDMISAT
jgi:hypothetical protein